MAKTEPRERDATLKEGARFAIEVFKRAGERWTDVEGFRLGAAFSYYATFSIFPLLLLAVTLVGYVLGDDVPAQERLLGAVAASGSPVRDVLEKTLGAMQESRSARGASAIIGLVSLFFSASGAFVELDNTLNRIWCVPVRKSSGFLGSIRIYLLERLSGLAIVAGIGLTLLASLFMSSILSHVFERSKFESVVPMWPAIGRTTELAVSIGLLAAVFVAAFHFIPRSRPPIRDVLGGAILTTALLTILKEIFATYLSHLTSYSAYGIVGGFLALATWIYLSSQIIFFGATLTRAAAELNGDAKPCDLDATGNPRATPAPAE